MIETEIELDELPEKPVGWRKTMITHIRAAQPIGSSGLYEIFDERGRKIKGILYGYRTGKDCAGRGFAISGEEGEPFRAWPEFREHYKAHRAKPASEVKPNG